MIKLEKFDFVFILTSIPEETCDYCGVKTPAVIWSISQR